MLIVIECTFYDDNNDDDDDDDNVDELFCWTVE